MILPQQALENKYVYQYKSRNIYKPRRHGLR